MFARFRNLFSRNKADEEQEKKTTEPNSETVADTVTVTDNGNNGLSAPNVAYVNSVDQTKSEGLNLLQNLVETEQHGTETEKHEENLSETIANGSVQVQNEKEKQVLLNADEIIVQNNLKSDEKVSENLVENASTCSKPNENSPTSNINEIENKPETVLKPHETALAAENYKDNETVAEPKNETDSVSKLVKKMKTEVMTLDYVTKETSPLRLDQDQTDNAKPSVESNNKISKTSLIKSWIQANNANFTPPTADSPTLLGNSATKLETHSSIVMEDLPSEVTTPSPTVDGSTISGVSSHTSTLDSTTSRLATDPTKIVVNPTGDNGLACNAITGKLTDIAEVAESLDTVIRGIQENSQIAEVESNPSPRDKTMGTLRSTSSEDWQSRSTEDESFVTASEGRTSSFMSCNKSSFDYSQDGDDSTVNFEMPDVNSPFNMSFDESEHSFRSHSQDNNRTPTKHSQNGENVSVDNAEVANTSADAENLHSESVTPTPDENIEYIVDSIPIESETELELAAIANAPATINNSAETAVVPVAVTPEVSLCSNPLDKTSMLDANATPPNSGQKPTNTNNSSKSTNNAWRRSKYYENITKQTIKGFL